MQHMTEQPKTPQQDTNPVQHQSQPMTSSINSSSSHHMTTTSPMDPSGETRLHYSILTRATSDSMNVAPLQQDVPSVTRSLFPPRPRNLPPSPTGFAVDVASEIKSLNRKKLGKSRTLEIFNKTLQQHETKQDTATATSTSTPPLTVTRYVNEHIMDISQIRVIASRDVTSRSFRFYVHFKSSDACNAMRHVISSYTTITCKDIPEHVMVGRVYPVPYSYPTETALSYLRSIIPSATLTRIQHAPPSTHMKEHAYISFAAQHYSLLMCHVFILPGLKTPLTFEKMNSISETKIMCSLCFQPNHTRSKCPHLNTGARFCSNCGLNTHLAKQCKEPRHCLCCGETGPNGHSIFDCDQYKPQYTKIKYEPQPHDFPPLPSHRSPSLSSSSPHLSNYDSDLDYPSPSSVSPSPSPSPSISDSRPQHKRPRHASFDGDSLDSHASRENRMLSPAFQQHLDQQTLTRRGATPSPSRDRSRSSSRSSVSSTISIREQQLEQQVKEQQEIIDKQQQEQKQQAQEIKQLKQQLALIMEQLKLTNTQTSTTTTNTAAAPNPHAQPTSMQE
jgi:hypothetical protein